MVEVQLAAGTRFRLGRYTAEISTGGALVKFLDANSLDDVAEILASSNTQQLSNTLSRPDITANVGLNLGVLQHQEVEGGQAADITYGNIGERIETEVGAPPAFGVETIENAAPTILVVNMDVNVNSVANDYKAGFSVKVGGVARTISSAARQADHKVIKLTLASAVVNGDVVLFSFDKSLSDLKSDTGAAVQSVTDHAVTNNVA